jgi:hypothetical protein
VAGDAGRVAGYWMKMQKHRFRFRKLKTGNPAAQAAPREALAATSFETICRTGKGIRNTLAFPDFRETASIAKPFPSAIGLDVKSKSSPYIRIRLRFA